MISSSLLSIAMVALAVAADPAPASPGAVTFESAAQPGSAFVAAQLPTDVSRASAAMSFARASERSPMPALTVGPGNDATRAVASWVSGRSARWLPRLDPLTAMRSFDVRPGPMVQLAVLIPLCLILLARQRRLERRFDVLSLPMHRPASRNLIRLSG